MAVYMQPSVPLLINGEFRESTATEHIDVTNPVSTTLFSCFLPDPAAL